MIKAINLKCEDLINPIGIDVQKPRLSWTCEGAIKQTAYKVVAYSKELKIFDSGKTYSDKMNYVFPLDLSSRQRVTWQVTLWDENDKEGETVSAFFEMGLLFAKDWKAKWITGNYSPKKKMRYPVDCFQKSFISIRPQKARLYITACGLYEARLNDKRVGDFVFAPGYTDYNKRIQYQVYDVTELIKNGKNDLTVELADGWYRGSTGAWGLRNQFGTQTKFIAQLEIVDVDEKITTICTDESWMWSSDGTIRFADNKDGEKVEAYRLPIYEKKAKITKHLIVPSASNNVPVKEHERLSVIEVIKTPKGKTVLDFGQNIAGYIEFTLNAKKGQTVFMRFGEMLDKEGEFTQNNIQCANKKRTKVTPLQQVEYICKDGKNHYKTKFSVFGFRYALLETDVTWKKEDFIAIAIYSDMERTGLFDSSNKLLNKFFESTVWSMKNNHLDVPTDCPTRERHGWTGDAQIFCGTAAYMFNFAPFAKKYLRDMYDWQKKNGKLPQIAPYGGVDFYMAVMNGSVGWADAGVIIPYTLWKRYGDKAILEEYYERMKKYAKFMMRRCGRKTILSKPLHLKHKDRKFAVNYGQNYGEWAEPTDVCAMKWTDFVFPHPEVATAYTSYIMDLMTEIATELGKTEDLPLYRKYSKGTKRAYRAIRQTKEYPLNSDRQAMHVRALYFDLLDKKEKEYSENRLIKALENYNWRIGTGFLSTPLIMYVLTKINPEYAYKLLENEQMPGWLFMPKSGATTIWESWEGTEAQGGIASLNHYSKGAVCEWLFNTMCGIRVGTKPNTFIIKPVVGGTFKYAKASYQSVYGMVESGWELKNGKTIYRVKVPCNCTAEVILPSGMQTVGAGEYVFEV